MYYNTDHYLCGIESYRSEVNAYIERDKPLVQYFYKKLEFNSLSEGKYFELNDYYDRDTNGFTNVDLVTTLSDSLIISIYGKYEYFLGVLCKVVQLSPGIGISHTMIKGQGIIAAVKYLDNLLNLEIKKTEIYKQMDIWRELRNTIAHNYSVPKNDEQYEMFKKIDIHTNGEIENVVTSMNDCLRLIETFESFFEMVFDKLLNMVNK
jgi:hypothetical protein